jgi:ankyrin repeat protein
LLKRYPIPLSLQDESLSPVHIGAWSGDIAFVRELIENGASVLQKIKHYTPLHLAALTEQYEMMELLLAYDANINDGAVLVDIISPK